MTKVITDPWYKTIRSMDVLRIVLLASALHFATEALKAGMLGDGGLVVDIYCVGVALVCARMTQYYPGVLRAQKHILRRVAARRNVLLGDSRYEVARDNSWFRGRWTIRDRKLEGIVDDAAVRKWIARYIG